MASITLTIVERPPSPLAGDSSDVTPTPDSSASSTASDFSTTATIDSASTSAASEASVASVASVASAAAATTSPQDASSTIGIGEASTTATSLDATDSTTTVTPTSAHIVTSTIEDSSVAPTTIIITSVVTQSAVSNGITNTNPVTVVVTTVNGNTIPVTLPLTTIYTPLPTCSSGLWTSFDSVNGVLTCTQSPPVPSESCYPPSFDANPALLYSPGVCPDGYPAAWTETGSSATTSFCCPSDMTYLQSRSICATVFVQASPGIPILMFNTTSLYNQTFTGFAPTIAVAWAPKDLATFTPASAPLRQLTTITSVGYVLPPTLSQTPTARPLSVGAEAGIGVGVSAAALLGIALGVWLFLRRRRKARAAASALEAGGKAELPGETAEKKVPKASELGPNGEIFESSGDGRPAELEPGARYELEGDFHGHEAGVR